MRDKVCMDCGDPVSGRRKRCPDCKRAEHARAMRESRAAAESGHDGWTVDASVSPDEAAQDARSIGGGRYQFATPYRPRPAAPEPDAFDYTQGGHDAPGMARLDLSGIPNAVRQDRGRLEQELARREFVGDDDISSDMMTWDQLQAWNSRPDDGRTVVFDNPAPGSPRRKARPDEGRSLSSMLRTGREPNVDYLGRSTRRPRSWR